jgi:hypothetical protein
MGERKPVKVFLQTPILQIHEILISENNNLNLLIKLSHINYDNSVNDFYKLVNELEDHINSTVCKELFDECNFEPSFKNKHKPIMNWDLFENKYTCFDKNTNEISINDLTPNQYVKGILELSGIEYNDHSKTCKLKWKLFQLQIVNSFYKLSDYSFKKHTLEKDSCSSSESDSESGYESEN